MTPLSGSEKKQVLHFCALGSDEMQKFVEDLKESIAEVTELEQIRIECKDAVAGWLGRRAQGQRGTQAACGTSLTPRLTVERVWVSQGCSCHPEATPAPLHHHS